MKFIEVNLCIKLVQKACKKIVIDDSICKYNNVSNTVVNVFNKGVDSVETVLIKWFADMLKGENYMFTEGGEVYVSYENEKTS